MRMNRRNVLVGLGTIVAGGGAALGTGAFSSVEADREVSVDVADDSDALLAIEVNQNYDGEDDPKQAEIDLSSDSFENAGGLNENARTTIDGLLAITNQGEEPVDIRDESENELSDSSIEVSNDLTLAFHIDDSPDDENFAEDGPAQTNISGDEVSGDDNLGPDDTVVYGIEFDVGDNVGDDIGGEITIRADQSEDD